MGFTVGQSEGECVVGRSEGDAVGSCTDGFMVGDDEGTVISATGGSFNQSVGPNPVPGGKMGEDAGAPGGDCPGAGRRYPSCTKDVSESSFQFDST